MHPVLALRLPRIISTNHPVWGGIEDVTIDGQAYGESPEIL
jgi:hypothetical protein